MTYGKKWTLCHMGVSTHMPLARHDAGRFIGYFHHGKFLLTCLLRGMTYDVLYKFFTGGFLLTCLLRGMTNYREDLKEANTVSTHMPLARHDVCKRVCVCVA